MGVCLYIRVVSESINGGLEKLVLPDKQATLTATNPRIGGFFLIFFFDIGLCLAYY